MHKLSLTEVSKSYGPVVALAEVDLQMGEGEFVTLLGPSGSGKSTLLKIIAGMTRSSTGTVVINGRDATDMPARERDLGMVFQNYSLMPHMTVFENVAFPLRVRKRRDAEIRERVKGALDTVQLSDLGDRKPAALSGGQQQRVAIARAIVYNPSLVLMDEPLGALDRKLREQLQGEIKQLHRSLGITILYVTHDQQEAMAMSDRIVLMNNGSIEQLGTPAEMYFKPITLFAADFLGESNFIDAIVSEADTTRLSLAVGEQVTAPNHRRLNPGEKVRMMIRPEQIKIGSTADERYSNRVMAIPKDATFLGGTTRYRFDFGGRQDLLVLDSNVDATRKFKPGQPVELCWQPESAVTFPMD